MRLERDKPKNQDFWRFRFHRTKSLKGSSLEKIGKFAYLTKSTASLKMSGTSWNGIFVLSSETLL